MSLTPKQQAFIEHYLQCWNASEAARRAGYNGKSNVVGPRLLANVSIAGAIQERLAELKMSADEVLVRLTSMGRSDIADFAGIERASDLLDEQYKGKTHVIKKFKRRVTHDQLGRMFEDIELELYPADGVLEKLGRYHSLFTDKIELRGEVTVKGYVTVSPDDWDS